MYTFMYTEDICSTLTAASSAWSHAHCILLQDPAVNYRCLHTVDSDFYQQQLHQHVSLRKFKFFFWVNKPLIHTDHDDTFVQVPNVFINRGTVTTGECSLSLMTNRLCICMCMWACHSQKIKRTCSTKVCFLSSCLQRVDTVRKSERMQQMGLESDTAICLTSARKLCSAAEPLHSYQEDLRVKYKGVSGDVAALPAVTRLLSYNNEINV